ncbi:hypothetical protein BGZ98_003252, partial [Dissophora globulifera]
TAGSGTGSRGDSTDDDESNNMELSQLDEWEQAKRRRKYAKITSTRRAVLTVGLTLISVVAVMGLVGCQASRMLRRR